MGIPEGSLHHADAGHHDCQFIQDRLDPGLGLSTSILCNAHSAAMRRQAQQAGTKTGGLREVHGDNIMPTQLTLNHNPRATASRREAADPIEGNELGIASIAGRRHEFQTEAGRWARIIFENAFDKR